MASGKNIGENIKKVRNKLGLTQDDLMRKSGVKHTTILHTTILPAFLMNQFQTLFFAFLLPEAYKYIKPLH